MSSFSITLSFFFISFILFLFRSFHLIRSTHQKAQKSHHQPNHKPGLKSCALTVLLGSGGHTAEMIRLLSGLPFHRYSPRTYLMSSGDSLSQSQIIQLESYKKAGHYIIHEIPRARRVNQSFFTSVFTTIHSLVPCLWLIAIKPIFSSSHVSTPLKKSLNQEIHQFSDLILLNGPGSAVPIALSAFAAKFIRGPKSSPKVIYVESLARVKRLSFTGIILLPFVDCFIVQWKALYDVIHQSWIYQVLYRLKLVSSITFEGWMV